MDNMRLGKGLFATHLFDGEPLGQTDTKTAIPYAPPVTGGAASGAKSPTDGGAKAPVPYAAPLTTPYVTSPGYDPAMYVPSQSSFDWTPVMVLGGGSLLAIGFFALLFGGKKKSAATTPNRRRKRRKH